MPRPRRHRQNQPPRNPRNRNGITEAQTLKSGLCLLFAHSKKPTQSLAWAFSWNPCGAGEEIRTPDLRITNALLYQLSYTGHHRKNTTALRSAEDLNYD